MAKNRKYQSAAIRFGPALKAFLLCLLIGGSGVGYVWQKSQIFELAKMIKNREIKLAELREQNKKLSIQLATLQLPRNLENRVRELNLGLVPPRPGSVVRLLEPMPAERLEAGRSVAARSNAAP
jgi:hypothetical protein